MKVPKVFTDFFSFLAAFYRGCVDYRNRIIYPIKTTVVDRYEIALDYPSYNSYVPNLQGALDSSTSLLFYPSQLYVLKFKIGEKIFSECVSLELYQHEGEIEVRYCVRANDSIKILAVKKA